MWQYFDKLFDIFRYPGIWQYCETLFDSVWYPEILEYCDNCHKLFDVVRYFDNILVNCLILWNILKYDKIVTTLWEIVWYCEISWNMTKLWQYWDELFDILRFPKNMRILWQSCDKLFDIVRYPEIWQVTWWSCTPCAAVCV